MLSACILLLFATAFVVRCELIAHRPFRPEIAVANEWMQKAEFIKKYSETLKTIDPETTFNTLAGQMTYWSSSHGNETICMEAIVQWIFDLTKKETYALQALDSFGKVESGILLGNIKWYGQYYECLNLHHDHFNGQWCGADFGQPSYSPYTFTPSLLIGICLPDACSQEFVNEVLQSVVSNKTLPFNVNCPKQLKAWTTLDIFSLVVILFLSLLLITGSVLDLFIYFRDLSKNKELSVNGDDNLGGNLYNQPQELSTLSKVFLAFSIQRNTKILFDTSSKPGNIDVIHGIRFFSICWIILGHTYAYIAMHISNFLELSDMILHDESFQIIGNGTFSVDAFFLISGLLVTYLNLRLAEKSNGKINIPLMYLNRYLRLTPAYGMVILVVVGVYSKFGEGPVWPGITTQQSDICHSYWWTNILYINNMHPNTLQKECLAWSWYLANDMQFFILAPIFIVLLIKKPKAGVLSLIFGICCGLLSTAVISVHYKEQPLIVMISQFLNFALNPKHSNTTGGIIGIPSNMSSDVFWSDIYAKPWCRISVYFIGMLTGYILHISQCRVRCHKLIVITGWMTSAVIYISVLFGLYHHIENGSALPVSSAAFYNTVSRPVWSLALAWLIVMCARGYGGFINTVLSFKLFVPLSRLTYCIYLIHPLVLIWMATNRPTDIVYSNYEFAFYFLACLMLSIFLAYILYMLVEQPVIVLQKMMMSRQKPDCDLLSEEIARTFIDDRMEAADRE